jgi:hypothetical protein
MGKRKPHKAPLVRVIFYDHSMSIHPHWHDGDAPVKPARGDGLCVAVGWITHADKDWLQVLHVMTRGQHGAYAEIHRGCVQSIVRLEPGDEFKVD